MPTKSDNIAATPGAETTCNEREAASDQTATFMARVIPWPKDAEPGYCNLHWTVPNKTGMRGHAYGNIQDFMGMARWGASKPEAVKDIYFCLSSQTTTGKVINGKATALRNGGNVHRLKALWLDVDVKPDKGYPTTDAAIAALEKFITDAELPPPTALVLSGSGGMHVYWISDRPLTNDEWQPYADGLEALAMHHGFKRDPGLTTDCVRILRVPGTWNYKSTPPKRVRLAALAPIDLNFEQVLGHIRRASTPVTGPVTGPVDLRIDPAKFPKRAFSFQAISDRLATGIHTHVDAPLDYAEVIKNCPHFQEAARTEGATYSQGLWMLDVLACTFMQDARPLAHKLSRGYSAYTLAETDAMFDRKLRERQERGLGWPSCKAIEAAGCKLCANCVHRGKIKSPLNLALPQQTPQPQSSFVDPYGEFAGPEFPLEVLTPTLRKYVDAEHRAMGADPSAIAMAALTTVAGAMHAETVIRAGEDWWERPILWTALVGQPSTMKSPIIDKAKKPLATIDHERTKRWRQEYVIWQQQNKK